MSAALIAARVCTGALLVSKARVRVTAGLVLALACRAAFAGPTPAPVRAEIDALLTRLQVSGCQFNRNGSWYNGAEAKAHLLQKLEYIEGLGTLQTTEQFIDLAAAKSSFSRKPYQVKCGDAAPVESRLWLGEQLTTLRGASHPGKR